MNDPPPPPQVSPDGRFYWGGQRRVLWLLVLLMVIAIVLAGGSHNTTTGESDAAVSPSNSTNNQSSAPAVAKVLMDKTGSAINNTPAFTTSGDWEIDWSYDFTNFGQSGNFGIFVFNSEGSVSDVAANQHGTKGAEVSHERQGGIYYLEIDSPCDWHVIVRG